MRRRSTSPRSRTSSNAVAPGIFQGVVDGVEGAARYLNSKEGGGGIAGRKLVVDFIDSKLAADATRNG